ncbi:MAG: hypothetical protein M1834_002115 [Cirrosporium novae-zelandiae]|nr:MAG: hypothetical protein M1834_002115 [Cirrosporium novae-zelandiae]
MAWSDHDSWLTLLLGPSLLAVAVTLVIVLTVPILLHHFFYYTGSPKKLPEFILMGPSGSGKTSLITYFKSGHATGTHTSQTPLTVDVTLPLNVIPKSSEYREPTDPALKMAPQFSLTDTPGHGKLRQSTLDNLAKAGKPQNIHGVIFLVDAAASNGSADLHDAAEYLYEVLMALQSRFTKSKNPKKVQPISLLIATNKHDLFTALPAPYIKTALEKEISDIRNARTKGLLDSAVTAADAGMMMDDEKEWLGDTTQEKFEFEQMEELNVPVSIEAGNVLGSDRPDVVRWANWIGSHL